MLSELLQDLQELSEVRVPKPRVSVPPLPGPRKRSSKVSKKPQVGQEGFPHKLATRGVREGNVLVRGLKYRAVELEKKFEVLKQTGGVYLKQQNWLDRHVLHPVTRINNQLDAMNAKMKTAFFEDVVPLGELLSELREIVGLDEMLDKKTQVYRQWKDAKKPTTPYILWKDAVIGMAQVTAADAEPQARRLKMWYTDEMPAWMAADSLKQFVKGAAVHKVSSREASFLRGAIKNRRFPGRGEG